MSRTPASEIPQSGNRAARVMFRNRTKRRKCGTGVSGRSGTAILLRSVTHMLGTGCVICATLSTTAFGTTATSLSVLESGRGHAEPMFPALGTCAPPLTLCRKTRHLLHRKMSVRHRKLRLRFLPLWYPLRGHRRTATGCVRCAPGSIPTRHTHAETPSAKANGIAKSRGLSQVRDLLTSSTSELRLRLSYHLFPRALLCRWTKLPLRPRLFQTPRE